MRGTPLVRLLLLALFLGGATILVARLAGPAEPDTRLPSASLVPSQSHGVATFMEATLSAPARAFTIAPPDPGHPPTFHTESPGLTFEQELTLTLSNTGATSDQITVIWSNPTQSNFLLLSLEPEGLETKSVTLHFPPQVTSLPLNLHWPEAASDY